MHIFTTNFRICSYVFFISNYSSIIQHIDNNTGIMLKFPYEFCVLRKILNVMQTLMYLLQLVNVYGLTSHSTQYRSFRRWGLSICSANLCCVFRSAIYEKQPIFLLVVLSSIVIRDRICSSWILFDRASP